MKTYTEYIDWITSLELLFKQVYSECGIGTRIDGFFVLRNVTSECMQKAYDESFKSLHRKMLYEKTECQHEKQITESCTFIRFFNNYTYQINLVGY